MLLRALSLCLLVVFAIGCAVPEVAEGRRSQSSSIADRPRLVTYFDQIDATEKKTKETDERLGRAMARVAPLLTDAQRSEFAKAFQALPDVHEAATAYREAAAGLDQALRADDSALGRGQVFEAYVRLARSPSPSGALAFAMKKLADDPDVADIPGSDADVVEKILVPALPGTFLEQLFATQKKETAISSLATILATGGDKCQSVVGWLQKPFVLGETDSARDLLVGGKSIGQALNAMAGLIVIWDFGGQIAKGDLDAALATLRKGSATAVGGVVDATSLVRKFLVHSDTSALDTVIKVGARLGGGIALLTSIFQLATDLDKQAWGRVAVDLVAIAGAVLTIAGVGPAMPVAILAIGLGLFLDWLDEGAREDQLRRDLAATLRGTSVKAAIVSALANAEPFLVDQLTKELKLGPEQIQWLVSVDDLGLTFDGDDRYSFSYEGLEITQLIFHLDAASTTALLRAAIAGESDPSRQRAMIEDLLFSWQSATSGWNASLDKASALAWLDEDREAMFFSDDAELALHRKTMKNVRSYLAVH